MIQKNYYKVFSVPIPNQISMIINKKYRRQHLDDVNCETPFGLLSNSPVLSPNQKIKFDEHFKKEMMDRGELYQSQIRLANLNNSSNKPQNMKLFDPDLYDQETMISGMSKFRHKITKHQHIFIKDKKALLTTIIKPGFIVKASIRKQSNYKKFMTPEYHLSLVKNDVHLISAKNYPLSREIFKFSLKKGCSYSRKNQSDFLGTLTCDQQMNSFWLHRPISNLLQFQQKIESNEEQLNLVVLYTKNENYKKIEQAKNQEINSKQKKKMKTYLYSGDQSCMMIVRKKQESIKTNSLTSENYLILEQNQAEHNALQFKQINSQLLDAQSEKNQNKSHKNNKKFGKKNVELIDEQGDDYRYLKLQQISDEEYYLQIQHPFSILQAYAAALTRFQACYN